MRNLLVLTAVLTFVASPSWAQDPPKPPVLLQAEACLTDNVAAAVRASSGAADAAEFLLSYVCAEQVERAATYERNVAALESVKVMVSGLSELTSGEDVDLVLGSGEDIDVDVELIDPEGAPPFQHWAQDADSAYVDPDTGDVRYRNDESGMVASMVRAQSGPTEGSSDPRPASLRVFTGRLVMDHRR